MRPAAIAWCAGLVGVVAGNLAAQAKPDFSGRWTSQPDTAATAQRASGQDSAGAGARGGRAGGGRAGRPGDLGSGWGSTLTITQDASRFIVQYMFFARGDMQAPISFTYALDGSESKNSVMMGQGIQVQTSRAAWQGDKLVITTLHAFAHPDTGRPMTSEVRRTLSLETPTSLVVETVRAGVLGGPSSTTRTVYRRL